MNFVLDFYDYTKKISRRTAFSELESAPPEKCSQNNIKSSSFTLSYDIVVDFCWNLYDG